jgi:hypothetical protein
VSNGALVVALIGALAALVLPYRALQSHGLTFERKAAMAAAWALIFVVLAFILDRVGA